MKQPIQREYWLRGPVPGFPPLLQPVVHALLQARDEVSVFMEGFPDKKLWERPAGVASVGFHLRHLTGVLDRLLTYARGEGLSEGHLNYLKREGLPEGDGEGQLNYLKREGLPEGDGEEQLNYLKREGLPEGDEEGPVGGSVAKYLVERFNIQVDKALEQIKGIKEEELTARRDVGRDRLPSTVGGLVFHAAEHTQRHVGQLFVTVKVVNSPVGGEGNGS
ncbi:MAG: DinB family protein [Bacteroidetes bacterium]|nr:DinB family protein [Bacteroidota bacterium]